MGLVLVTPPDGEPVVPAEVVDHLRLEDDTQEDDLLAALVTAARQLVENRTNRALLTQTWDLVLDGFPGCNCPIQIPKSPLQSVTSVKYIDTAGVEQTLATSDYLVDSASMIGRITPAYGKYWPSSRAQVNAVTIRFVAGYGDAAAVPASIKAAMKLLIGNLYENREATELPAAVDALLGPYRVVGFP